MTTTEAVSVRFGKSLCTAEGFCGCSEDQQCIDGQTGDLCNEGRCRCTSDMNCSGAAAPYDGGMITCN